MFLSLKDQKIALLEQRVSNLEKENDLLKQQNAIQEKLTELAKREAEVYRIAFEKVKELTDRALKLAEIAGEYLSKGSSVYVEGSLKTEKWEDRDGNKKQITKVIGSKLIMLGENNTVLVLSTRDLNRGQNIDFLLADFDILLDCIAHKTVQGCNLVFKTAPQVNTPTAFF